VSAPVPNSEPESFTAGETVSWTKFLAGYDSATYALKYALQAAGKSLITISAGTGESDGFAVNVAGDVTAAYSPGCYIWTAYVEGPSGPLPRTVIARGAISILPSPLIALGTTHASRMLAAIELALEGRIPNGLETTDIDGQRLDRIPVVDLARLRDKYAAKVKLEQQSLIGLLGGRPRTSIGIRFVRP